MANEFNVKMGNSGILDFGLFRGESRVETATRHAMRCFSYGSPCVRHTCPSVETEQKPCAYRYKHVDISMRTQHAWRRSRLSTADWRSALSEV